MTPLVHQSCVMGTHSLLAFRVRNKVVLKFFTQFDGYPSGNTADIARFLIELGPEIVGDYLVAGIVAALKTKPGNFYAIAAETFPEADDEYYDYMFDVDDCVKVSVNWDDEQISMMTVRHFCTYCEVDVPASFIEPTVAFKELDESKYFEYVTMVDEQGHTFFHAKVFGEWNKVLSESTLSIHIGNGIGFGEQYNLYAFANGIDCLALQVLKLSVENVCKEVILLPDFDPHTAGNVPVNKIAFYDPKHLFRSTSDMEENAPGENQDDLATRRLHGIHHISNGFASVKVKTMSS